MTSPREERRGRPRKSTPEIPISEWQHPRHTLEAWRGWGDQTVQIVLMFAAPGDRREGTSVDIMPAEARKLAIELIELAAQAEGRMPIEF